MVENASEISSCPLVNTLFFLLGSGREWRHTAAFPFCACLSLKDALLQTVVSDGTRFCTFLSE